MTDSNPGTSLPTLFGGLRASAVERSQPAGLSEKQNPLFLPALTPGPSARQVVYQA